MAADALAPHVIISHDAAHAQLGSPHPFLGYISQGVCFTGMDKL